MGVGSSRIMVVVLSALLTVLALDLAIARVVPHPAEEYDVADGVRDYRRSDPDVLILGSSYVRSFLPMRARYAQESPPTDIAIVAVEGGKFSVLDWILRHRLLPLMEQRDAAGQPLRRKLRHVILQTNYYDLCGVASEQGNLPSRAWRLGDYLRDVAANGVTAYNENYVDSRWKQFMEWSILVSDRGFFRIIPYLRQQVGQGAESAAQRRSDAMLEAWVGMIERHHLDHPSCHRPDQEAALASLLSALQSRDIEVSVLLWPVIPKAHTPQTLEVTGRFRDYVAQQAGPRGIEVIDLQSEGILRNEHFRPDLDHLTAEGDRVVSEWASRTLIRPGDAEGLATLGERRP